MLSAVNERVIQKAYWWVSWWGTERLEGKEKSQGQQKTSRVHRYICYLAYAYKAHQTLYLNCVCEDVSLCYVKLLKAV